MSGSINNSNYIGSGSDTITLNMSEDPDLGEDATFTVNVDGQQIGGPQTITALHAAGQTQAFTFAGNFAPGPHDVTVTFSNNFIWPNATGDRNAYVEGITYDGQTISNSEVELPFSPEVEPNTPGGNFYGNVVYKVNDTTAIPAGAPSTPTTTPGPVSVGSGADTLVLNMAEDPYQGDAQFTIAVDGKQIGGTQTTTAVFGQGQSQEFDVHGNFGGGQHTVTVNFTNDYIGGFYPYGISGLPQGTLWALDTEDRNLYIVGTSLDGGPPASGAPWEQAGDGPVSFTVTAGSNPSATDATSGLFATDGAAADSSNIAITPGALSTGSSSGMSFVPPTPTTTSNSTTTGNNSSNSTPSTGSDTLVLDISENAWMGDAQYTVSVDGQQVSGILTASASNAAGQSQAVTLNGNWGAGSHTVSVDYLNDAYGGTPSTDRNLYVTGASYDGVAASPATLSLSTAGAQSLTVGSSSTAASTTTTTANSASTTSTGQSDTLSLSISEDAWMGNAQYAVSVDGQQVGNILTATASHAAGQSQTVTFNGSWGSGAHQVSVDYLNDAWGGTISTDRNLYVTGASYNGVAASNANLHLYITGSQSLTVG